MADILSVDVHIATREGRGCITLQGAVSRGRAHTHVAGRAGTIGPARLNGTHTLIDIDGRVTKQTCLRATLQPTIVAAGLEHAAAAGVDPTRVVRVVTTVFTLPLIAGCHGAIDGRTRLAARPACLCATRITAVAALESAGVAGDPALGSVTGGNPCSPSYWTRSARGAAAVRAVVREAIALAIVETRRTGASVRALIAVLIGGAVHRGAATGIALLGSQITIRETNTRSSGAIVDVHALPALTHIACPAGLTASPAVQWVVVGIDAALTAVLPANGATKS